jgi:hypothetical protein
MPSMCIDCFEPDRRKYRYSQVCKKCEGELVEIDENFLAPIAILNQKGYYTDYCCSGHCFDKDLPHDAYISFSKGIKIPNLPRNYQTDKERYPFIKYNDDKVCIRSKFISNNLYDAQKEILQSSLDVLEWAFQLPDHLTSLDQLF